MGLSEQGRAIIDHERSWWQRQGSKESSIRSCLGVSSTHYYRQLSRLLDLDEAYSYDPLVVRRLRKSRERRRRERFEGRSADGPRR
jgi:hypothetical protein